MQRHGSHATLAGGPGGQAARCRAPAATHSGDMELAWLARVCRLPRPPSRGAGPWFPGGVNGAGVWPPAAVPAGPPLTRCFPCFINLGELLAATAPDGSLSAARKACRVFCGITSSIYFETGCFYLLCLPPRGTNAHVTVALSHRAAAAAGGSCVIIHLVQTVSLSGIKSGVSVHLFR